jgi:hypothetical protein
MEIGVTSTIRANIPADIPFTCFFLSSQAENAKTAGHSAAIAIRKFLPDQRSDPRPTDNDHRV